MAKTLTQLHVGIGGDLSGLQKSLSEGLSSVTEFGSKVAEVGEKIAEWVGIGAAIELGRTAMDAFGASLKAGFETADHIETATIAFTGLAGSAQNAAAIMANLRAIASSSSIFNLDQLTSASRKLIAVGVDASALPGLFATIGDVSAGSGASVETIAAALEKAAAEGSVNERSFKELGAEGVPIIQELAKQFNTTADGVRELAKDGKIGFNDLKLAFEGMTKPGGKFAGLMEAQANSAGGLFKRLKTQLSFDFADIASQISEAFNFKGALQNIMTALPNIVAFIQNGIGVIAPYIMQVADGVGAMATNIYNYIKGNWGGIAGLTTNVLSEVYNIFSSTYAAIAQASADVWTAIQTIWNAGDNIISSVIASWGGDADGWGSHLKEVFSNATVYLANFQSAATTIFTAIGAELEKVTDTTPIAVKIKRSFTGLLSDLGFDMNKPDIKAWVEGKGEGDATQGDVGKLPNETDDQYKYRQEQLKKKANPFANINNLPPTAWADANVQANKDFSEAAAKTIAQQEAAKDKIGDAVGKIFNGFTKKPLELPPIAPPPPVELEAMINPEELTVGVTPVIHTAKLLKYGSGEYGLATYGAPTIASIAPAIAQTGTTAPRVSRPIAATAPSSGASTNANKDSSDVVALLNRLVQYIVKWDSNPPLGTASF